MPAKSLFEFPPVALTAKQKSFLEEKRKVVADAVTVAEKDSENLNKWRREHEQLGEEIQQHQLHERIDELNRAVTKRGLLANKIEGAERGQSLSLPDAAVATIQEIGESIATFFKGYTETVEQQFGEILAPLWKGCNGKPIGWAVQALRDTPLLFNFAQAAIQRPRGWGRDSNNFLAARQAVAVVDALLSGQNPFIPGA